MTKSKFKSRPVFFTDLDDTLFQTRRKIKDLPDMDSLHVATVDRQNSPHSYMTEEQAMLADWLLEYAEVIPVTARNTEQLRRVQLPFTSWQIATHGAVLLTPDGQVDPVWQSHMLAELQPYRDKLLALECLGNRLIASEGFDAWTRINYEYDDVPVYLTIKHRSVRNKSVKHRENNQPGDPDALLAAMKQAMGDMFDTDDFYFHHNDNNLAFLPKCVDKGLATHHLLQRLRDERGVFPLIGMGDSLSDHRFMKLCDWFAIPQRSQFADTLTASLFGTHK
ncbi:hypothetical protein [Xenorhabdus innexi]|uniref:Sucrose phosphatase-like domain-containing protein n=1 Tax=Xenorhabdus innexi TaxID=290109 RepID=A0A1N6N1I5_9GAMM|nr:hypothetical protein [Xenorhabdus innexi]PHM36981.1 hypothetical protein Xinn_01252 [Xenorhabdus innexi]SIP74894.1 conserved hypothetical protein [Xenorhabdus innexi]